jgi:hypothetical protein
VIGQELAYVRAQLGRKTPEELKDIAKATKLNVKTLNRLRSKKTKYGRTDTVGKLAMHFRTKERRKAT